MSRKGLCSDCQSMAILSQVPHMILASCQCVEIDCLPTRLQFRGVQNAGSATRERSAHLHKCVYVRLGMVPRVVRASQKRLSCLRVCRRLYRASLACGSAHVKASACPPALVCAEGSLRDIFFYVRPSYGRALGSVTRALSVLIQRGRRRVHCSGLGTPTMEPRG